MLIQLKNEITTALTSLKIRKVQDFSTNTNTQRVKSFVNKSTSYNAYTNKGCYTNKAKASVDKSLSNISSVELKVDVDNVVKNNKQVRSVSTFSSSNCNINKPSIDCLNIYPKSSKEMLSNVFAANMSSENVLKKNFKKDKIIHHNKDSQRFLDNVDFLDNTKVCKPDIKPTNCFSHIISKEESSNYNDTNPIRSIFDKNKTSSATGKLTNFNSIASSDFSVAQSHFKSVSHNKGLKTVESEGCPAETSNIWVHPSNFIMNKQKSICTKLKPSYFDLSPTKKSHSSFDVNKSSFSHSKIPSNIITTNNKDCIKSLKENLNLNRTQNPAKSTSKLLSDAVGIINKKSLPIEKFFEQVNTSKHNLLDANRVSTALDDRFFTNKPAAMSSLKCKNLVMPNLNKGKLMGGVYNEVKNCFLHYFDAFNDISLPCQSNSHVKDEIDLKVPFLCETKNNEMKNISKVKYELTENKKSLMKPLNSQKLLCHEPKDDRIFNKVFLKNLMPTQNYDKKNTSSSSALPILKTFQQKVPNRTKSKNSNCSDKNSMKLHSSCYDETISKIPKNKLSVVTLGKELDSCKLNFHQPAASCNNLKNQLCKDYRNFKLHTYSSNSKIKISNRNNYANTAHTTKFHSKSTEVVATSQKVAASSIKICNGKSKTHFSISNSLNSINISKSNHVSKRD